ncbi:MAG: hypothetical protein IKU34_08355 [Clostridia bacterium]|nr:hypothetical protein [Clostridia bacterium]
MRKGLTILAIVMLVVTIAAAGAMLYGIRTLTPQVVDVTAAVVPAAQQKAAYDAIRTQLDEGLFGGRLFSQEIPDAEDASFVSYNVRLKNRGFFPAEWISLRVAPLEGDVLQLENGGANVLLSGSQGDMNVTLLTTLNPARQARTITIECYVFGRKQTVSIQAQ